MPSLRSLLGAAFFLCSTVVSIKQDVAPTVKGAYIAEFADDASNDIPTFYNKLGAAGHAVTHRMDLKYNLFKGVSFRLDDTSNEQDAAQKIAAMPEVKQLWPVRLFKVPNDEVIWTGNSNTALEAVAPALSKRQSSNFSDTYSPHVMTQVDRLRAEGITGKGVKIAVIDTGVDYRHPALGGCFGEGCLIAFGTDLVGDNYTGSNTPVPDPDPLDTCEGHGTHVSGIIAAQANNPYDFTGAAPDVTLGMYRVFGCSGSAGNDVLIAAFNQAHQDGADIITASIGGASGWSEDPWSVAVQRIVEAGTPCTVSAGNDGTYGLFYASTAANGKGVTAVASVDNVLAPFIQLNATYTVNNGTDQPFGWTEGTPSNWGNVSLPLWAVNYNTSDAAQACNPLPDSTPDLSNYIVLVRRGTCTFVQKATNVAAKGARYVMFYNNVNTGASAVEVSAVEGILGAGMVTADQGVQWIQLLSNGSDVTLNIIDPDYAQQVLHVIPNNSTGGFLSTYTSWGPTYELDVKPQVAAPGGLILSTYPLDLGAYAVLSGTSMACPLTAAIVALVSNVRGTLDPAVIESVLSANANPNLFQDGRTAYPYLAPVAQQGAGLIQAYDAAHAVAVLSTSSLAYNDTDYFEETMNFTIQNTGSDSVTYNLGNVGAATGYTLPKGDIYPAPFPNELVASYADLEFSEGKVTVPAGGESTVAVTLTPPGGLDGSRLAVYSGYITLNGSNGDSLSLPYQGVVGSMHDATVLDPAYTYLSESNDTASNPVANNTLFIIPANNATVDNSTVYPTVVISMTLGSAYIRADVVPLDLPGYHHGRGYHQWPGSQGGNGHGAPPSYGHGPHFPHPKPVLGLQTLGDIYGFPYYYAPRGPLIQSWDGMLEDGSMAPAGRYKIVARALHIFGDRTKASEYDVGETQPFRIQYK